MYSEHAEDIAASLFKLVKLWTEETGVLSDDLQM